MNADSLVVLDACVLANFGLCDLFLTLAETSSTPGGRALPGGPNAPAHRSIRKMP